MSANAPGLFDEERLTTPEAAKLLRISVSTLQRMRTCGGGPMFEKNGTGRRSRVVYRRIDLENWRAANRFASTSEYHRRAGK